MMLSHGAQVLVEDDDDTDVEVDVVVAVDVVDEVVVVGHGVAGGVLASQPP
jgi:carbonic anhydrase